MTTTTRFKVNKDVKASAVSNKLSTAGFINLKHTYDGVGFEASQGQSLPWGWADYVTVETKGQDRERLLNEIEEVLNLLGYFTVREQYFGGESFYLVVRSEDPALTKIKIKVAQAERELERAQAELDAYNATSAVA